MNTEATGRPLPLDTPGLSSARQATSGTGVVEVRATDISTMALPGPVLRFHRLTLILPGAFEATRRLPNEEADLRKGLLSLLSFKPEPDQPTDEDIHPRLEYNFPD